MAALRIGVTLGPAADVTQLLWASGIHQNTALLILLLLRLPGVGTVVGVDAAETGASHPLATWCGVPTLPASAAAGALDLIIECGGRAAADTMSRFRDGGGRLVSYMAGNAMALDFEALSSGLGHGEVMSLVPFDATWITPQHWHMNRALCLLTRSAVAEIVPHIWEPVFIDALSRQLGVNPFFKSGDAGVTRPWRLAVLEPNVNVLKTFHLPLLVAEEGFRRAPERIDRVLLFNTAHLAGVPHFDDLTSSLDLNRAGKLFAEARLPTPEILARHADAVVVHQWENDLNYLYWDVLWTGHPLIHNSAAIEGVGYRYADFDPADGGRVLADALAVHAGRAGTARRDALAFLRRFSIDDAAVVARHEELIESVMSC